MDERERRIVANEVLFRQINEEIDALERGMAAIADKTLHVVCECGNLRCEERIVVPLADYERVRSDSTLFIIAPGHEFPSTETVVEEQDHFHVVRKRDGGPARMAKATDSRS
jgi:hypothetical protein